MSRNSIITTIILFCSSAIIWQLWNNSEAGHGGGGWVTILSPPTEQKNWIRKTSDSASNSGNSATNISSEMDDELAEGQVDPLHQKVRAQTRDYAWAGRTESDIETALREVPYLMKAEPVLVICGSNICQARGKVISNSSWYNAEVAENYLRKKAFSENLARANALTDEVLINSKTGEFSISFSRVRR
jgi:hypothetical protein